MTARRLTQLGVGDWIALAGLLVSILGGVIHLHARVGKLEGSVDVLKTLIGPAGRAERSEWLDESKNANSNSEQRRGSPLSNSVGRPSPRRPAISAGSVERLRAPSFLTPPHAATAIAGKSIRGSFCNDTRFACGVERPVAQPPPNAPITFARCMGLMIRCSGPSRIIRHFVGAAIR